jgi:hypothetical protein
MHNGEIVSPFLRSLLGVVAVTGVLFMLLAVFAARMRIAARLLRIVAMRLPVTGGQDIGVHCAAIASYYGFRQERTQDGNYILYPPKWRLGVKRITIEAPDEGVARVTGPAPFLRIFPKYFPGAALLMNEQKPSIWGRILRYSLVALALDVVIGASILYFSPRWGPQAMENTLERDILYSLTLTPEAARSGVPVDFAIQGRPDKFTVKVPAGVTDGTRLRLKGEGNSIPEGSPPGDLYIIISVKPE